MTNQIAESSVKQYETWFSNIFLKPCFVETFESLAYEESIIENRKFRRGMQWFHFKGVSREKIPARGVFSTLSNI